MKAVVLDGVNSISTKEIALGSIGANELLLKIDATGICGSDRHILHGTYPANYPVVLGMNLAESLKKFQGIPGLKSAIELMLIRTSPVASVSTARWE